MMMAMMDELYRVIDDNDDNDAMLMIIMITPPEGNCFVWWMNRAECPGRPARGRTG